MTTPADRIALTCWACRIKEHYRCPGSIILTGGDLEGIFPCACTAPGHPKETQTEKGKQ